MGWRRQWGLDLRKAKGLNDMTANEKQSNNENVWFIKDGRGDVEFVGSEQDAIKEATKIVGRQMGMLFEDDRKVRE